MNGLLFLLASCLGYLMIGIWVLIMRRMQGGGGTGGSRGIFNFGKSRAKLSSQSSIKVTFKDVAGADEAKQELEEIIEFLKGTFKISKIRWKNSTRCFIC